jgi:hypothetical protein
MVDETFGIDLLVLGGEYTGVVSFFRVAIPIAQQRCWTSS